MSTLKGSLAQMDEAGRLAGEAMIAWLREMEGYCGLAILTDEETGTARVITFWATRDDLERGRTTRLAMRDKLTATVGMEVVGTDEYVVPMLDVAAAQNV